MQPVVISGTGLWKPDHIITNEELVNSYNAYATAFNEANAAAISDGEVAEKPLSSVAFIEKASGIKQRYVYAKEGILDIDRMRPVLSQRSDDELSHQAEMAVHAAKAAMAQANKTSADIDMVIVSCAYTQRSYPAIAIEVQDALGIDGSIGCRIGHNVRAKQHHRCGYNRGVNWVSIVCHRVPLQGFYFDHCICNA